MLIITSQESERMTRAHQFPFSFNSNVAVTLGKLQIKTDLNECIDLYLHQGKGRELQRVQDRQTIQFFFFKTTTGFLLQDGTIETDENQPECELCWGFSGAAGPCKSVFSVLTQIPGPLLSTTKTSQNLC